VLTGIKTVASLRAEKWAVERYSANVLQAQKYSVKAQVYSRLAAGIMGLLFYTTYMFAFIFGTYQVSYVDVLHISYILQLAKTYLYINCSRLHNEPMWKPPNGFHSRATS
jgi:ABC-type bacteriocin/lantibiotic exporter with double-glycine peptidase domain